ncbi:MAG: hypothetical protein JWO95_197 [Verrucomicrobiales bacterium]|nr:hypothetical protein [Verrucomicrobiales bacterium]
MRNRLGDPDELPQARRDLMRLRDHFRSAIRREPLATINFPQPEPRDEMLFAQSQRHMFDRHTACISSRSARDLRPEPGDFLDVCGPVLHLAVKDRVEKLMLAHVGVEVPQQSLDCRPSTKSLK